MELRHLRYFLAVAEEAHFGRAARRLHIVQSALSMQIRALEDELGGRLFLRSSRTVSLTEAGKVFRLEAQRTVDQAEYARLAVQRSWRGETGRVRVGFAGNAVFSGKLMGDIRRFHAAFPDAELVVEEVGPQQQGRAILAGQLDIGYTPGRGLVPDPLLIAEPIGHWPLMVAMHRDHPLAAETRLRTRQLAGQPLVLYTADEHDPSLESDLAAALGQAPSVAYRAANTLTVLALAASGLGLALVPEPLAQVSIAELLYIPLEPPGLPAGLNRLSRAHETNGAVNAFLAMAREG